MITVTAAARAEILRQLAADGGPAGALRVSVDDTAPPPGFGLSLVTREAAAGDRTFDGGGFELRLAADVAARVEAVVIDFDEAPGARGFRVRPTRGSGPGRLIERRTVRPAPRVPRGGSASDAALATRVRAELDRNVNATVAAHGGAIRLDSLVDGVARIVMSGGCQGCGAARLTLKGVVERMLRSRVPGLRGVEDVTDHDAGVAPYVAASA